MCEKKADRAFCEGSSKFCMVNIHTEKHIFPFGLTSNHIVILTFHDIYLLQSIPRL